ncbi:MAG: polysaccharide deacetylase family protein [Actinobacteria bacterium]|nr:polysaccharide deacetylase family protein [Actinomycetota bacterium]
MSATDGVGRARAPSRTGSRERRLRRAGLLLLPLSLVPFVFVVPQILGWHSFLARQSAGHPLPAVRVQLTRAQARRFQPVPLYRRSVPVLLYHGIGDRDDGYAITRRTFAEHMAALARMRFHTITIDQYVRFRNGDAARLPPRPILITFDDGLLDSYRGADRVLAEHGFNAAVFVSTHEVDRRNPRYLTWSELHRMRDSGRWDVEAGPPDGYERVAYDGFGRTASAYAVRRYTEGWGLESLADYEQRVSMELFDVRGTLRAQGFEPVAFAVPKGDYGQRGSNDARIAPLMRGLLHRQFEVAFTQRPDDDPGYTRPRGDPERFEIHANTTTDRLYMWLRDHAPRKR